MGSLLLSLLLVVVVVAAIGAVLAAVSALPFVVAVDMAERRGFSPARWGGLELVLLALAATVTYLGWKHNVLLMPLAVLLAWAAPLLLSLLSGWEQAVGGRQGAHEG